MYAHRKLKKNDHRPEVALTPAEEIADEMNDHLLTTTLPIELMTAIDTHLDGLNEDCLTEIFSKKSLTPMDLCELSETCKLFKRMTHRLFPNTLAIYRDCSKYSTYSFTLKKNEREIIASADDVQRILKCFGSNLVAVAGYGVTDIMNSLGQHCAVGTLKELTIGRTKITRFMAVGLKSIFQQLQKFTILNTPIRCAANVFANFDSLIELSIVEHYGQNRYDLIMENYFPKLQRFTFADKHYNGDSEILINFLERHKTLKCVHLPALSFSVNNFFPKLGLSCKELEELKILRLNYAGLATLDISNFQRLKRLQLCFGFKSGRAMIVRLKDAKSLEVLEINGVFHSKKFIADLPLLNNLRELNLQLDFTSETVQWSSLPQQLTRLSLAGYLLVINNVVEIIRHLSNLEELEICARKFVLGEKEFYEIVRLTTERRNVLKMKCRFEFSQSSGIYKRICNENSKVKLIKWEW